MDQGLRNKLRSVVTQCRKLLEDAVAQTLQGQFGIYSGNKGEVHVEDAARMAHLSEEDQTYRKDILDHFDHIKARGYKPKEALDHLIREIAFTHLNRLCAYKLMEVRQVWVGGRRFREAVSRGQKSQGFLFYLADHPEDETRFRTGQQDVAYRHFLDWLGDTLSEEIGVLFNPNDPANRLYPPQRVLDAVLALINSEELAGIWAEDETIGWVYQYFTPKELRDKARKESPAPRNTYELAFRNQFFTPRYVVEFLTDNTLGRIWYEMRKGDTKLKDQCRYMVRRPSESFLEEGKSAPKDAEESTTDLSQEELLKQLVYIPHRPKKDPRDLTILDPACGSGHFLLYGFDLLLTIYEEAYNDSDLGPALKKDYPTLDDLRRVVPGLILSRNLHGIDIDLRATQIAALTLWLRAHRAYQEMEIKGSDRPKITRSNIVCAEPMPGEQGLLEEFVTGLQPTVLGQLVRVVFERMSLAGDAGSLLKIAEGMADTVAEAKKQWLARPKVEQLALWPEEKRPKAEQLGLFDISGITDEAFWHEAEARVLDTLHAYSRHAANGTGLQRQLFTDDAIHGFAFVDLCRKRFDVVVMNPPFGEFCKSYKPYAKDDFPNTYNDIFAAFIERNLAMLLPRGMLGAITSRTGFFLTSFTRWRENVLLKRTNIQALVDLGSDVLDTAMVETAAYCLEHRPPQGVSPFIRVLVHQDEEKQLALLKAIEALHWGHPEDTVFFASATHFNVLPDSPFVYWIPEAIQERLTAHPTFEPAAAEVRQGLATGDDSRFVRALWEVRPADYLFCYYPSNGKLLCRFDDPIVQEFLTRRPAGRQKWAFHVKAGASQPWFSPITVVVDWENDCYTLRHFMDDRGKLRSRPQNTLYYFRPGFSWTRQAVRFIPYAIPTGCISTVSRYMAFPESTKVFATLGVAASNCASAFLRFFGEWFTRPNFLVENLKALPWPDLSDNLRTALETLADQETSQRRSAYQNHEPFQEFVAPSLISPCNALTDALAYDARSLLGTELEREVAFAYGLKTDELSTLERDLQEALAARQNKDDSADNDDDDESDEGKDFVLDTSPYAEQEALISYSVGCVIGRWDIRVGCDASLAPALPGPFDPLPVCPPGRLVGPDGLPATPGTIVSVEWLRQRLNAITLPPENFVQEPTLQDFEYPLRVSWDSILVDDADHPDDVVRRIREVLEVLWVDQAEHIEQESCEILGVRKLRDYFRKPGNGGFWMDHVKRYSKSRRKAPIYWLLQSSKKSYALWIYYHRLDKDILFKALLSYVEPKIRLEESRLEPLRAQRARAGASGKGVKKLEKDIERQEEFISELRDFEDKLRRVANLHLEPDLNDGVVLNIARSGNSSRGKRRRTTGKNYSAVSMSGRPLVSNCVRGPWSMVIGPLF